MSPRAVVRVAREVFLTSGALLGVLCLLLTTAGAVAGVKPLVFRSGSMSPSIHTGDLGISRTVEASTLRRGDVVSVVASGGERVTHRLVNIAKQGDARQLTLRGDANKNPDREVYTVTTAEKVLFHVPKAGYVVNATTSPAGIFVLGLYVAGLLALVLRRRPPDDPGEGATVAPARPKGGSRRAERSGRARVVTRAALAVAVVSATAVAAGSPASAAAWTDEVAISGTTFSAFSLAPPSSLTCSGGGLLAPLTYSFPNADLRYQYVVTLENSSGTVFQTDIVNNNGSVGVDQSVTYGFTLLNGFVGVPATITVRVRSRLTATTGWVSNTSITQTGKLVSVALVGLSSSCT